MEHVNLHLAAVFGTALAASVVLTPVVRALATRAGLLAAPVDNRWHRRPVALLGGLAIVGAFAAGLLASGTTSHLGALLVYCGLMFTLGTVDDLWHMRPLAKLGSQAVITAVFLAIGPPIRFTGIALIDVPLVFVWLVGITNALNLLDNIDGLCAGIAGIAGLFSAIILAAAGETALALTMAAFVGAVGGFLIYNFQPASIFMGDGGSFFIGSFLAGASVLAAPSLDTDLAPLAAVPVLLLLIPIFDTTFVTITRGMAGRSALVGGRDHTSHRLVALGVSERGAVLALYALAAIGGTVAVAVQQVGLTYAVAFIGLYVTIITAAAVVLGHVDSPRGAEASTAAPLVSDLTYRYRIYEILLDGALAAVAYYFAFRIRFQEPQFSAFLPPFLASFPFVLACQIGGLWIGGKYRQVWRSVGSAELVSILRGVTFGIAATVFLVTYLYRFEGFSRGVFLLDGVVLLFLLVGSRLTITSIDELLRRGRTRGRRVLIYGAGRGGALMLRELQQNRELGLHPVGFIDDDRAKQRIRLEGLPVLGGLMDLQAILARLDVEELLVSVRDLPPSQLTSLLGVCRDRGIVVRRMRFTLDVVDPSGRPAMRVITHGR